MLRWSVIFLVVAIIAAVFGFGGIAGSAVMIAKVLFTIFIVLFLLSLIVGLISERNPANRTNGLKMRELEPGLPMLMPFTG